MTKTEPQQSKTFLSIKKASIYLGLAFIGLVVKFLDLPGNVLILVGLGLFLGHISYRSVIFPRRPLLKVFTMLLVTFGICFVIFEYYNIIPATIIILAATGLALIIDRLTK